MSDIWKVTGSRERHFGNCLQFPDRSGTMKKGLITLLSTALVFAGCIQNKVVYQPEEAKIAADSSFNTAIYLPEGAEVPLFKGMGSYHRKVSTSSSLAQRYFDQAMTAYYAFNHDQAISSFQQAARLDPECAMAWWGIAMCEGPNINNSMATEKSLSAWNALQKGLAVRDSATSTEKKLLEALTKRYTFPAPQDRKPLDQAYADSMAELWREHPMDSDVGTLYAEAMMNLRPWDLWTHDGHPKPGTERIVSVLEDILAKSPDHPFANHLYIHAVEPSPHFRKAIAAADRLRDMVPASGHLVHMPTHIDVLVGSWDKAVRQNELAIEADRIYLQNSSAPSGEYAALYVAHNFQMLAFASMMSGQSEKALKAAHELVDGVSEELARTNKYIDSHLPIVYEVLMRFGHWDKILEEEAPPDYLPLTNAMWHYSRGVAFGAKGKLDEADHEHEKFLQITKALPKDENYKFTLASDVFAVADNVLSGEIAFHRGNYDEAVTKLRTAVRLEADLTYEEPPVWIQPARHSLGAILVKAGRYKEAKQVYQEDLNNWPKNVWSLHGLANCLRQEGAIKEADEMQERFSRARAKADTGIDASCFCVIKK